MRERNGGYAPKFHAGKILNKVACISKICKVISHMEVSLN